MARYFFDTDDGTHICDEIGQDIEDWQSLREEALIAAAERSARMIKQDGSYVVVLTVRDGQGNRALTMRLACQVDNEILPEGTGRSDTRPVGLTEGVFQKSASF